MKSIRVKRACPSYFADSFSVKDYDTVFNSYEFAFEFLLSVSRESSFMHRGHLIHQWQWGL